MEVKIGSRWVKAWEFYCIECERYATAFSPHAKYCSNECKQKAYRRRAKGKQK